MILIYKKHKPESIEQTLFDRFGKCEQINKLGQIIWEQP